VSGIVKIIVHQVFFCLISLFNFLYLSATALGERPLPKQFQNVGIQEHLGQTLPGDLVFQDSQGKSVQLKDYFTDDKPVVISLNYLTCTTLCSVQLNGLVDGLKLLDRDELKSFRLLTISIDPTDTPEMATHKKAQYETVLNRQELEWTFLVGVERNIKELSDSIGFQYSYDQESEQYVHAPALFFIDKNRKISRYLYGLRYFPQDLRFALIETSEGRLGSPVDKLILFCFHYDDFNGKYTSVALNSMRTGGLITVGLLLLWLLLIWRKDLRPSGLKGRKRTFI